MSQQVVIKEETFAKDQLVLAAEQKLGRLCTKWQSRVYDPSFSPSGCRVEREVAVLGAIWGVSE